MSVRRGRARRYIALTSLILIISFTNLSMSPSYLSLEAEDGVSYNLHPQIMSKPILDEVILDKGMLGFVIMEEVRQDPGILTSGSDSAYNLFSDLGSKTVKVFFANAEEFEFDHTAEIDQPNKILVIPCRVGEKPYNVHLFLYDDGRIKSTVYSEEEHNDICEELKGKLSSEAVDRLLEKLGSHDLQGKDVICFIDATDESVRSVMAFLEKIGAESVRRRFQEIVDARKLLLVGQPVFVAGAIAVREAKDEKRRAQFILESILIKEGITEKMFGEAFESFWELWRKNRTGTFRLDEVASGLGLLIREIERGSEDASNEGYADRDGKKGMIRFSDEAYEHMIDLGGIALSDCKNTIEDIKKIFHEVALHEIREHDKFIEGLKMPEEEKAKRRLSEETRDIPGMDPDKIVVRELSKCLLPTDLVIVEETGGYKAFREIRISESFVKMMHKLRFTGIKGELGMIRDPSGKILGEIYSSIIYSLAVHTIRGHFSINEYGFAIFNPDEFLAQRERGRKHLYINLLAMMYYWITVVERSKAPGARAEMIMKYYPQIFAGLTKEQRKRLPSDLIDLCYNLIQQRAWHYPVHIIPTETTAEEVEEIFRRNPDAVSNEGETGRPQSGRKDIMPGLLALKILRLLFSEGETLSKEEIMTKLADPDVSDVSRGLDVLVEAGVAVASRPSGAKEMEYKAVLMSPRHELQIEEILRTENDLKKIKGMAYQLTERRWVDALVDTVVDGLRVQEIRARGEKIILALETDWIPGEQKVFIQQLIQELDRLGAEGTVRVVRGDSDTLATSLMKAVEEERASLQNVVVLASQNTLEREEFDVIRAKDDGDTDKAFLAGVDASGLKGDSYIRLLEMLTMAVRMALGQRSISSHPEIEVTIENARTVIFFPKAEPLNYDHIKKIYDAQRRLLIAV